MREFPTFQLLLLLQNLEILTLSDFQGFSTDEVFVNQPGFEIGKFVSNLSSNIAIVGNTSELIQLKGIKLRNQFIVFIDIYSLQSLCESLKEINKLHENCQNYCWIPKYFLKLRTAQSAQFNEDYLLKEIPRRISVLGLTLLDLRSNVFLSIERERRFKQIVFEIFIVKNVLIIQPVLFTSNQNGVELIESSVHRRKDFRGILINGVTQDDRELDLIGEFERSPSSDGKLRFKSGISVAYFQLMSLGLNFSIGAINGTGWIYEGVNGTPLGMAEQVKSGEADVIIANSELLPYRLRGLRFLQPYYRGRIRAFFKQPPQNQIRNIFFHPLQPELWLSLGILWLLLVFCLKLVHKLRTNYFSENTDIFPKYEKVTEDFQDKKIVVKVNKDDVFAKDAFLWAIGSACGQGWHMLPQSGTMKLMMLSGLITFIFSYTAYSAAIVTNLSIFLIPIKNWGDLLNSGFTIYGDNLLQTSRHITNASSIHRIRINPLVPSEQTIGVNEALKLMSQNKPVAIISVFDQFYQIASKTRDNKFLCKTVSVVNVNVSAVKGGMVVADTSPFRKFFNYQTIMIQERGLDARISIQYQSMLSPGCLVKTPFSLNSYILEINDVFTAFAILLCGFLLSLFAFLAERIFQSKIRILKEKSNLKELKCKRTRTNRCKSISTSIGLHMHMNMISLTMKVVILIRHVRYYFPVRLVTDNIEKLWNFLRSKLHMGIKVNDVD